MLEKLTIAALLVGSVLLGGSATAGAGEWNKHGYVHGETDGSGAHPAHSICAYSGLDDPDVDDDGLLAMTAAKGRVQSPGQYVTFFGPEFAGIPGQACRGNAVHE